jgi:ribosome biogenesis protein MAK21
MPSKPDLASHTLASFLDRFVYRNAKAAAGGPRGGSIMQPLPSTDNKGIFLSNRTNSHTQGPVNTEAFWRKKIEDVAVDEVFFHKYFSQAGRLKKVPGKARRVAGDEEDEEDENEDEIWQALVDSRPEVEGDGEDSDMEMLDLDELDAASSTGDSEIDQADGELDFEGRKPDASNAPGEDLSGSDSEIGAEIDELFAKELQTTQLAEEDEEGSRAKRRRLRGLPTFASVEEYAEMLDNDDDEDM